MVGRVAGPACCLVDRGKEFQTCATRFRCVFGLRFAADRPIKLRHEAKEECLLHQPLKICIHKLCLHRSFPPREKEVCSCPGLPDIPTKKTPPCLPSFTPIWSHSPTKNTHTLPSSSACSDATAYYTAVQTCLPCRLRCTQFSWSTTPKQQPPARVPAPSK